MQIGNQYSQNKLYTGIKFYDSLPLMSGDLHEYEDNLAGKRAILTNNLIGQGLLSDITVTINSDATSLSLADPAAIIVNGEISLIQSDEGTPFMSISTLDSVDSPGTLCILGWFQEITSSSTLRNYGGCKNSILDNDLINEEFNIQISSRYQFRWIPVAIDKTTMSAESFQFSATTVTAEGTLPSKTTFTATEKISQIHIVPTSLSFVLDSTMYLIPIADYTLDNSKFSSVSPRVSLTARGNLRVISQNSEPLGSYESGAIWYNPDTQRYKMNIESVGFVEPESSLGMLQYHNVYVVPETIDTAQDITIPVGIIELEDSNKNILMVSYEGLILTPGEHYTADYAAKTITLLDFTVIKDEKITFTLTKLSNTTGRSGSN